MSWTKLVKSSLSFLSSDGWAVFCFFAPWSRGCFPVDLLVYFLKKHAWPMLHVLIASCLFLLHRCSFLFSVFFFQCNIIVINKLISFLSVCLFNTVCSIRAGTFSYFGSVFLFYFGHVLNILLLFSKAFTLKF